MIVIWAIGILALLFATYVGAARYGSIEAARLSQLARANILVETGINIAILDLLLGKAAGLAGGPRFGRSGTIVSCAAGPETEIAISVFDEGGKVDLNMSSPDLLVALLTAIDRDSGPRAAREILLRREAARDAQQAQGVVAAESAALRTILELDQMNHIGQNTSSILLPLVTVHSRSTGVDPEVAPAGVLRALSPGGVTSRAEARRAMPSAFSVQSPGTAFLISVGAMASGMRASRDAVVVLTPDYPNGYRILEQRDGSPRAGESSGALLPC